MQPPEDTPITGMYHHNQLKVNFPKIKKERMEKRGKKWYTALCNNCNNTI